MAKCGRKRKFEKAYNLQVAIEQAWFPKLARLARQRSVQEDKTIGVADMVREKVAELLSAVE